MRITDRQRQAIKDVIFQHDPEAKVYLFGSRVDNQSRGGDIDLLILSEVITEQERRALKIELYDCLGEQKLDLVIAKDLLKPFVRIALQKGELL